MPPFRSRLSLTITTLLFSGGGFFVGSGCSPPASPSLSPELAQTLRVVTIDYNDLVALAVRRWNTESKDPQYAHLLDPENVMLSPTLRESLQEIFPPEPDVAPENVFVAYIDEVSIPHPDFAFLTVRTTNRYDATEFAIVCERVDGTWQIRDYFVVAEGLLQTALHNFNWDGYESSLVREGLIK